MSTYRSYLAASGLGSTRSSAHFGRRLHTFFVPAHGPTLASGKRASVLGYPAAALREGFLLLVCAAASTPGREVSPRPRTDAGALHLRWCFNFHKFVRKTRLPRKARDWSFHDRVVEPRALSPVERTARSVRPATRLDEEKDSLS